jgi:hypothetical protein
VGRRYLRLPNNGIYEPNPICEIKATQRCKIVGPMEADLVCAVSSMLMRLVLWGRGLCSGRRLAEFGSKEEGKEEGC